MINDWITVTEATYYTGKSGITIRRWCSEHKNNTNAFKKDKGKSYININFIKENYPFINDEQKIKGEETKHKKEAMQIAYNSETIKAQIEQIKTKDKQIEQLIYKKSYLPLYITIGFIILFIFLGFISYYLFKEYKLELINNQKSKIVDISANHQKEVRNLSSNYQKEVTNLTSSHQKEVEILKDQLIDTKKTYSVLIKEIKDTNNKLTVNQSNTIDKKENEIERLQKELNKINSQTNTDSQE